MHLDLEPPSTPLAPILAALVAACLCACSTGGAGGFSADLLSRAPDALLAQAGAISAGAAEPFGASARAGWEPRSERDPDGAWIAWSSGPRASLFLDALDPADRELELELRSPHEPLAVALRLNGVSLGDVHASSSASALAVGAPAAAWRRGRNVLELEAAFVHAGAGGRTRGLGLARVAWDRAVAAEWDPGARRVRLEPGAGAAWVLEGSFERLSLRSEGGGALALRYLRLDPLRGETEELVELELAAGESELELPGARPLVVELSNRGTAEAALTGLVARGDERAAPPPIVFVSIDTFSARHASVHGYPRATTPALERFAEEAVAFTAARANAPFTLKSYLSQLTGLYPAAHVPDALDASAALDVEARGAAWSLEHLDPGRFTLAEALRAAGYRTAAFVDNPWLDRGFGMEQGFDVYDASAARIDHGDPSGGSAHVLPLAEEWLDGLAPADVPFLFVQVLDLHHPYLPVAPFDAAFAGDGLWDPAHELPVEPGPDAGFGSVPDLVARGMAPRGALPALLRTAPIIDAYDQKLRELDSRLGALFDSLRARGLWDRAIVVVSADHGEAMLEHGYCFNHGLLYDEHVQVPLLVKLPGSRSAGAVVAEGVQLVDLYPTLLELAGLGPAREHLHGRSLVSALEGRALAPLPSFAEGGAQEQRSVVLDGWKLIESVPSNARMSVLASHPRLSRAGAAAELEAARAEAAERGETLSSSAARAILARHLAGTFHELYHLPDDPLELRDLAGEHEERVAELLAVLARERSRASAARMGDRALGAQGTLSDADLDGLRALGYAVGAE